MPPGNRYQNKIQSLGNLLDTSGTSIMDHDYTQQSDYNSLLEDTQANILKSHRKSSLKYFFLFFDHPENARVLLSKLANVTTSAKTQLQQIKLNTQPSETAPFLNVYLTYEGYKFLGISKNLIPDELEIADGKLQKRINLHATNPFIAEDDVHAIVLYGDEQNNDFPAHVPSLQNYIVGEMPCQRKSPSEHYKFTDGISNPRFFPKPNAFLTPFNQVLLHDKASNTSFGCGSYGVLMKFQMNDDALDKLSASFGGDKDKTFANVMGRFKNGAPITHYEAAPDNPDYTPENKFNYQDDFLGSKCPFHAHARKSYPRTQDSIKRQIVRRGMFYKEGDQHGLMFMSFQKSLVEQFEYILENWILNENVLVEDPRTGKSITKKSQRDMLFGEAGDKYQIPDTWNSLTKKSISIPQKITEFLGGLYFYAPSISFLNKLHLFRPDLGEVDIDIPFYNEEHIPINSDLA